MRSNPVLGPAMVQIHSNLDPKIKPGSVLSIEGLLTASNNMSKDKLELTENYLSIVAGYDNYQTYSVAHTGSNFTKDWSTKATGLAPTKGTNAPIGRNTWFK